MKILYTLVFALCMLTALHAPAADHHLGLGLHYWQSMNDFNLEEDYDDSGASWVVTYQARGEYTAWELDLEILPENYGGSPDPAYAPQLYLLAGRGLYAGLGIGVNYIDSSFEDTFFAVKAGLEFSILPRINFDFSANYRFQDFSEFGDLYENVDGDTITLGAAARWMF